MVFFRTVGTRACNTLHVGGEGTGCTLSTQAGLVEKSIQRVSCNSAAGGVSPCVSPLTLHISQPRPLTWPHPLSSHALTWPAPCPHMAPPPALTCAQVAALVDTGSKRFGVLSRVLHIVPPACCVYSHALHVRKPLGMLDANQTLPCARGRGGGHLYRAQQMRIRMTSPLGLACQVKTCLYSIYKKAL